MVENGSMPQGAMTKEPALKPFLKWAGGKRWLIDSGQFLLPSFPGRYFEPFLGGGALFFASRPDRAVLSDSNSRLIELYKVVRDAADELKTLLESHALQHSREYYYHLRAKRFRKPVSRAAQFLYLNRTCWNGLYRENKKGKFNVPIGTKQTVILSSDDFSAWSEALENTSLECRDFEGAIDEARAGDFLFLDPPYTVRHNVNGFVKYNQTIFSWSDQIRLRNALERAANRGACFAMTNADHESVRALYSGFGTHHSVSRSSVIAGGSMHRGPSIELLVIS